MGKILAFVLGFLIAASSILGGIAFFFYSIIVLGVLQIVEGATTSPVNAKMIAWGVAWIIGLGEVVAATIMIVGLLVSVVIFAAAGAEVEWRHGLKIHRR